MTRIGRLPLLASTAACIGSPQDALELSG